MLGDLVGKLEVRGAGWRAAGVAVGGTDSQPVLGWESAATAWREVGPGRSHRLVPVVITTDGDSPFHRLLLFSPLASKGRGERDSSLGSDRGPVWPR